MDFISKLSLNKLSELVAQTKNELFLSMPAIPGIVAQAIIELKERLPDVSLHILIDFDPQTFRQGYGEFGAYSKLREKAFNITSYPDNRISFIIVDEIGYFLFIESQYLIPAEKETLNAVTIDKVGIVKLKQHFFGSSLPDFTNDLSNAIIEVSQELKNLDRIKELPPPAITTKIDEDLNRFVANDIKKNPPLEPNFKRILNVYNNKFQYVDLRFNGVNIKDKEVKIPKDLLPIKDINLKDQLTSSLKVIQKDADIEGINELIILNEKLKQIRTKYLVRSSVCEKNILKVNEKDDFKKELDTLKKEIPLIFAAVVKVLNSELEETQKRFWNEVHQLVLTEPEIVFEKKTFWSNDEVLLKQAAKKKADDVIKKIKWPDYFKLVEKMEIRTFYSDIAYEDLKNEVLLAEFVEKGLISEADIMELADFITGIKADPTIWVDDLLNDD